VSIALNISERIPCLDRFDILKARSCPYIFYPTLNIRKIIKQFVRNISATARMNNEILFGSINAWRNTTTYTSFQESIQIQQKHLKIQQE
jgi:hypothetical protein